MKPQIWKVLSGSSYTHPSLRGEGGAMNLDSDMFQSEMLMPGVQSCKERTLCLIISPFHSQPFILLCCTQDNTLSTHRLSVETCLFQGKHVWTGQNHCVPLSLTLSMHILPQNELAKTHTKDGNSAARCTLTCFHHFLWVWYSDKVSCCATGSLISTFDVMGCFILKLARHQRIRNESACSYKECSLSCVL